MPMLYVCSQEIKTKAAYQYGYIECMDKNGNVVLNKEVGTDVKYRVVAVGNNFADQCTVSDWKNIKLP